MARRCRWPPDSRCPRSPIVVWYPSGSAWMNSWACAARAAASIASRERVGTPVGDVARDGVVKQHRLLGDDADLRAQRRQRDVADVHAVDPDRAAGDVVEARDQIDQRRLARAAAAHNRDHLAGLRREAHAAQDRPRVAVIVGEDDVVELQRAPEWRQRGRARASPPPRCGDRALRTRARPPRSPAGGSR